MDFEKFKINVVDRINFMNSVRSSRGRFSIVRDGLPQSKERLILFEIDMEHNDRVMERKFKEISQKYV